MVVSKEAARREFCLSSVKITDMDGPHCLRWLEVKSIVRRQSWNVGSFDLFAILNRSQSDVGQRNPVSGGVVIQRWLERERDNDINLDL
jgi:hypothetical protein